MLDFLGEILGRIIFEILFQVIVWVIVQPFRLLRWCYRRLFGRPGAAPAIVETAPPIDETQRFRPEMD